MDEPTHTSRFQGQLEDKKKSSLPRWLAVARVGWIGMVSICVLLLTVAVPVRYSQLAHPPLQIRTGLLTLGLPLELYIVSNLLFESWVVLGFFVAAALLFWRKSNEWFPLLVAFLLVTFGIDGPITITLVEANPAWSPLTGLLDIVGWGLLGFFLSLFPDGRFVPRWTLWYNIVLTLYALLWDIPNLPAAWHPFNWPPLLFLPLQLGPTALFLGFQIYRYRYVSGSIQRQQTKWLLFGLAIALCTVPFLTESITPTRTSATIFGLFGVPVLRLLWLFIPLSLYIAIMRYRLWDIDIVINRTLVYGSLTACIVGMYALMVGGLGTLLQVQGNFLLSLVAAGLVAVIFHPLRERLQRLVNRLFYGQRDEPYTVLAHLGSRLEAALAPKQVLSTIVETTAHALKLPYVALVLEQDETAAITTSFGTPTGEPTRIPLLYQGERLGKLLVSPRSLGDVFGPGERGLLEDLAHQASGAVYAVRLTITLQGLAIDLQRSRTHLVTMREEERRRLRRDLHDGLGSVLTALNLQAGAIRALLLRDTATTETLLEEQQQIIRTAIADIRRLTYDLRPPSLDELGLLGALRERAAHYTLSTSALAEREPMPRLQVTVEGPENLPVLPAAVEVATYRIVQEALANVARHSQARSCRLQLSVEDGTLQVEVTDDGVGLPSEVHMGGGLLAMREHAAELGGSCHIQSGPKGGTHVCARLPFLLD